MTTKPEVKTKIFEHTFMSFIEAVRSIGMCEISHIVQLIQIMQKNKMDIHLVIAGQNGAGKTYLNLILAKELNKEKFFDQYYMADKTSEDIVQFVLSHANTTLNIDELNQYLYYKQHASDEQNHLVTMLELARSKRIPIIGCIRDPRKLTLNYRDGKMSVIIWILDRYTDDSGAYAVVLVGNPALEGEDRFGISYLEISTPDFEDMRSQFENLPSFVGYLRIPNAKEYMSEKELSDYESLKDTAMAFAHLNYCIKRYKKGTLDASELTEQCRNLEKILGKEAIESRIVMVNQTKQKKMNEFLGDDD